MPLPNILYLHWHDTGRYIASRPALLGQTCRRLCPEEFAPPRTHRVAVFRYACWPGSKESE